MSDPKPPLRPQAAEASAVSRGSAGYSIADLQQFQQESHRALARGRSLAVVNKALNDHTAGAIPSYAALNLTLNQIGHAQDRASVEASPVPLGMVQAATDGATLGLGRLAQRAVYGSQISDMQNQQQDQFRQAHPFLDMGSQVVGGVPLAVATGMATLAGARSLGGRAALGGLLNAGEGAIQGAAMAPDGNRAMGGLLGAGFGAAGGILGEAATPLLRRLMPGAGARIGEEYGARIAHGIGLTGDAVDATQAELAAMQRSLSAARGAHPGPDMVLGDTRLGRPALDAAATNSAPAMAQAAPELAARTAQAPAQLEAMVAQASGGAPRQSAQAATEAATEARSAAGRAAFAPLEQLPPLSGAHLDEALNVLGDVSKSPDGQRVWNRAQQIAKNYGYSILGPADVSAAQAVGAMGGQITSPVGRFRTPDFLTLQSLERGLEQVIRKDFGGMGDRAASLMAIRADLRQAMENIYGREYQAARGVWRDATKAIDAPKLGARLWNGRTDILDAQRYLATAPAEAAEAFKQAARDELRRTPGILQAAVSPGSSASQTAARQAALAKMSLVFDPQELATMVAGARASAAQGATMSTVKGSQTAARQAAASAAGFGAPTRLSSWPLTQALNVVNPLKADQTNLERYGAPWLAERLTSQNPASQGELIRALRGGRMPSLWDALPFAAPATTSRGLTGLLTRSGQ